MYVPHEDLLALVASRVTFRQSHPRFYPFFFFFFFFFIIRSRHIVSDWIFLNALSYRLKVSYLVIKHTRATNCLRLDSKVQLRYLWHPSSGNIVLNVIPPRLRKNSGLRWTLGGIEPTSSLHSDTEMALLNF